MHTPTLLAALAACCCWTAVAGQDAACAAECPEGWTVTEGARAMCYRVYTGPLLPAAADAACREQGATLASLADEAEHAMIVQLCPAASTVQHESGAIIGLKKSGGQWVNPDGADASYLQTKWNAQTGEPDGGGDCVGMAGAADGPWAEGGLNDFDCVGESHAYACGMPATCKEPECPDGWTGAGGRAMCYQAYDGPLKHDAAIAACGEEGGTLASIADAEEHAAVVALVQATKEQADAANWDAHMALVGLKKDGGQWANPDGADAAFALTLWNENSEEPRGDGDCVEITGKASDQLAYTWTEGSLNDLMCNSEARPYVCGKLAE